MIPLTLLYDEGVLDGAPSFYFAFAVRCDKIATNAMQKG